MVLIRANNDIYHKSCEWKLTLHLTEIWLRMLPRLLKEKIEFHAEKMNL